MSFRERWDEFWTGMGPRIAEWRFMLRRFRKNYLALTGLIIVLFFAAIAIMAPVLAPPHGDPFSIPIDTNISPLASTIPTPPTARHIWGTVSGQYDLYYACIWGTITAFRVGVLVVAVSLIAGLAIGVVAAYYGGLLDEALMRFTDIIMAFPGLILAMALSIALPSNLGVNISLVVLALSTVFMVAFLAFKPDRRLLSVNMLIVVIAMISTLYFPLSIGFSLAKLDKVMISIALVGWPGYARIIRGEVLRVKNEDYVEASKASGSSDFRVITRHILPNSIYPVLIVATLDIGSVVLTAAALSFIGIGAPPYYADWGQVISKAQQWMSSANQIVSFDFTWAIPGLFMTFFVIGWNLLGDGLRDILDPMLRRR
jgi:peptide/nickel transport system permease protein